MSKKSKRKLQVKAQSVWRFKEDGIWDIFIGLMAIWLGLVFLLKWPAWAFSGLLLLAFIPYFFKKWMITPRSFCIKRENQHRRVHMGTVLIMLVAFGVVLSITSDEPGIRGAWLYFNKNLMLMSGILFGMSSFYLAYTFDFSRLYFYGLLILVGLLVEVWLTPSGPYGFVIVGGLIIISAGLFLLVKFLRAHPAG